MMRTQRKIAAHVRRPSAPSKPTSPNASAGPQQSQSNLGNQPRLQSQGERLLANNNRRDAVVKVKENQHQRREASSAANVFVGGESRACASGEGKPCSSKRGHRFWDQ